MRNKAETARESWLFVYKAQLRAVAVVKRPIRITVFACLALIVAAANSQAQVDGASASTPPVQISGAPSTGIEKGMNEVAFWNGISFSSPTLIGQTRGARFGNFGVRVGRVFATSKDVAFVWTVDAVPLAVISLERVTVVPSGSGGFVQQKSRESVYGSGVSPIGLKVNFRRQHRVQPFAGTSGGFIYFGQIVPVPGAARFNFTYDFTGGVQILNSSRRAFTVGYKFQHISNAGRSAINPGVDAQMLYAGFSFFN